MELSNIPADQCHSEPTIYKETDRWRELRERQTDQKLINTKTNLVLFYYFQLTGKRTSTTATSTRITISLYCDPYYYGAYCTTYCKPQDSDIYGHYTCKPRSGEKICRYGWTGKDCKTRENITVLYTNKVCKISINKC